MRVHWAGIYGLGIVACAIGFIWVPQHRTQFVLSSFVFALAVIFSVMAEKAERDRELVRSYALRKLEEEEMEPETLLSNGWPTETGEKSG